MPETVKIEICAGSVESAIAARQGGAHRIELCTALSEGGLTPSQGMTEYAKNILKLETFVLIRPRPGDFNYSRAEFDIMKSDIFAAKARGADGIVVGMINTDGTVDTCRMKEIVEMAGSMQVTFHRAFDMTRDPSEALETIIGLGCHRILTSGQAATALDGAEVIARLVAQAGKRIAIMPGGGINPQNLRTLYQITGATEYHTSASSPAFSRMRYRREGINMGKDASDEYSVLQSDKEKVAEICNIARELC